MILTKKNTNHATSSNHKYVNASQLKSDMHNAEYANKSLTFVSTKAQVAFPAAHVDECDKRVDVRATAAAADDHTRLDHWQLLFVNKQTH